MAVAPDLNSEITILFADHDGSQQKLVAALLARTGYNLILANGGNDALQKSQDFAGVIHLLLSNVELPGMSGIELATQLNRDRPVTKILLLSGLPSGMLLLNNGWQFLPKPFMSDMLRDRIRDYLDRPILPKAAGPNA